MNIIKRTCATCVAFNPSATGEEVVCGNLTFITEHHGTPQAVGRDPGPADWCPSHMTHKEDRAEDAAIAGFWQRLGIEPKRGRLPD